MKKMYCYDKPCVKLNQCCQMPHMEKMYYYEKPCKNEWSVVISGAWNKMNVTRCYPEDRSIIAKCNDRSWWNTAKYILSIASRATNKTFFRIYPNERSSFESKLWMDPTWSSRLLLHIDGTHRTKIRMSSDNKYVLKVNSREFYKEARYFED
jgi:hypothetical protein